MSKSIKLQDLVKHIVNGTFEENVCRICLLPLRDYYEDMFTAVCKEDYQYCMADVLKLLCNIQVSENYNYRVCSKCFVSASEAYKFYLLTSRNEEILNHCINGLQNEIETLSLPENFKSTTESLCITLPSLTTVSDYDFNISEFPFQNITLSTQEVNKCESKTIVKEEGDDEDNLVIIMDDNGEPIIFKPETDGTLTQVSGNQDIKGLLDVVPDSITNKVKRKRQRKPMKYKTCSRCPVKYRFVRKLKEHMKEEHGIEIFVCKVCQTIVEDEEVFNNHLQTHSGIHTCSICGAVFKKRENIIGHLKWHDQMKELNKIENAHVCEVCGLIFQSDQHLKEHYEKKHVNNYTCYYCGKMYKGEISFEIHIKKHEMNKHENKLEKPKQDSKKKRKFTCSTCNKDFVDERSLLWHERLHRNERPYACDVCGRKFVSLNRRNQHTLCSHTAPARRCPLCPALFHLRSMVNTHIRKVHLKTHKRRNRTSKHQNVFWKTETVPIQELSISIQNELLDMQASAIKEAMDNKMVTRNE